jgi:hypothetical protein
MIRRNTGFRIWSFISLAIYKNMFTTESHFLAIFNPFKDDILTSLESALEINHARSVSVGPFLKSAGK